MVEPAPQSQESCASNEQQPNRQSAHTKISWDEEIIAEHDKERGTRMKVEEPETPFLYYNPEGDEVYGVGARTEHVNLADRWDEVTAKLEHIQRMNPDERLDMVAGDGDESQRARKFASKRAAHYDEYKRLQQWRDQRHAGGDEEEENDAG